MKAAITLGLAWAIGFHLGGWKGLAIGIAIWIFLAMFFANRKPKPIGKKTPVYNGWVSDDRRRTFASSKV